MFESIVSFIKSLFSNSNIRCYFRSDCCNRTQASDPPSHREGVCSRNPQEIKSKISRIIHLWNIRETHKDINKIKIPWRKVITT